jgi:hypothetical protein
VNRLMSYHRWTVSSHCPRERTLIEVLCLYGYMAATGNKDSKSHCFSKIRTTLIDKTWQLEHNFVQNLQQQLQIMSIYLTVELLVVFINILVFCYDYHTWR